MKPAPVDLIPALLQETKLLFGMHRVRHFRKHTINLVITRFMKHKLLPLWTIDLATLYAFKHTMYYTSWHIVHCQHQRLGPANETCSTTLSKGART